MDVLCFRPASCFFLRDKNGQSHSTPSLLLFLLDRRRGRWNICRCPIPQNWLGIHEATNRRSSSNGIKWRAQQEKKAFSILCVLVSCNCFFLGSLCFASEKKKKNGGPYIFDLQRRKSRELSICLVTYSQLDPNFNLSAGPSFSCAAITVEVNRNGSGREESIAVSILLYHTGLVRVERR